MSTKSMQELIGRVISDETFRKDLLADPEVTLRREGFEASPEIIEAIRDVNPEDLTAMARDFEKRTANRKAAV